MYCPDCGTLTSTDQKFCRGCGANLTVAPHAQSAQQLIPDLATYSHGQAAGRDLDERGKYTRRGFILFWSGIMVGALFGILGDAMTSISWRLGHFIENLAGLGGLVILAGLGFMIYSRFFPPATRVGSSQPRAIPPAPNSMYNSGRQPDPSFESRPRAPSVTEHTTHTLDQQRPGPRQD
jgi:hypothetical protein